MSGGTHTEGWFHSDTPDDEASLVAAIRTGSAMSPDNWPARAIDEGFVADEETYYDRLGSVARSAAAEAVRERSEAGDEQLKHRIRALDDIDRVANELAERGTEWAVAAELDVEPGLEGVLALADHDPATDTEERIVSLAEIIVDLREEREQLRDDIERGMHDIAPNLAALAGPLLGARLIALAGSLERLAKLPSGTVQVLGAEDALFAHLNAGAPPPKHGLIYTHEFVRGTSSEERGSASRALAGKLSIAARIDHYSGDLRPPLEADLQDRIDRIRGRSS